MEEEEKKRKKGRRLRRERRRSEKRAAKCGLWKGERGDREKEDGRNVYSVAVAIAAARTFNPVVIATWAAMTRKTK